MKVSRINPVLIILALLGIAGTAIIVYATRWGPWVYSDSTGYIFIARNFLAGKGLGLLNPAGKLLPLTIHPPMYSLLLSAIGLTGIDLVVAARWLNVVLFGLTVFASGALFYSLFRSAWGAIALSSLILVMPIFVDQYSGAMAEPPFFLTGILGMFLVIIHLERDGWFWLTAAGILTALSMLFRYSGIAWVATAMIALLLLNHNNWKRRIAETLYFGLLNALPIGAWLLRSYSLSPQNAPRDLQFDSTVLELLIPLRVRLLELFWGWLPFASRLPAYSYNTTRNLSVLAFILLAGLTILNLFKLQREHSLNRESIRLLRYALFWLTFVVVYIVVLIVSSLFTRPAPDLINRTVSPIWIGLVIALILLALFYIQAWSAPRWTVLLPISLVLVFAASYAQDSFAMVHKYHENGAGYTSPTWRASPTIQKIKTLPEDIPIITNESAAVLFLTGRSAYTISEIYRTQPYPTLVRYGDDQADSAQTVFREQGGALVLFDSFQYQIWPIYEGQTSDRIETLTQGLTVFADEGDGTIYFYKPAP